MYEITFQAIQFNSNFLVYSSYLTSHTASTTMPLPEDQTLSSSAPIASGSGSGSNSSGNALPPARDLSGIMDKFRQLGEEAEGDGEGEGEGDEDGEASEGDEAIGVDNEGATEGQGGEGGKKKKKKKKKSKAGKAVDKLK